MISEDASSVNLLRFCRSNFDILEYSILNPVQFSNKPGLKKQFDVHSLYLCYVCLTGTYFDTTLQPDCVPQISAGVKEFRKGHRYSNCYIFTSLKDAISHCSRDHKHLLKLVKTKGRLKAQNYGEIVVSLSDLFEADDISKWQEKSNVFFANLNLARINLKLTQLKGVPESSQCLTVTPTSSHCDQEQEMEHYSSYDDNHFSPANISSENVSQVPDELENASSSSPDDYSEANMECTAELVPAAEAFEKVAVVSTTSKRFGNPLVQFERKRKLEVAVVSTEKCYSSPQKQRKAKRIDLYSPEDDKVTYLNDEDYAAIYCGKALFPSSPIQVPTPGSASHTYKYVVNDSVRSGGLFASGDDNDEPYFKIQAEDVSAVESPSLSVAERRAKLKALFGTPPVGVYEELDFRLTAFPVTADVKKTTRSKRPRKNTSKLSFEPLFTSQELASLSIPTTISGIVSNKLLTDSICTTSKSSHVDESTSVIPVNENCNIGRPVRVVNKTAIPRQTNKDHNGQFGVREIKEARVLLKPFPDLVNIVVLDDKITAVEEKLQSGRHKQAATASHVEKERLGREMQILSKALCLLEKAKSLKEKLFLK